MQLSYQSKEGHTTLTDLSPAEVRTKFDELISYGYAAFADTRVDLPVNVKSVEEAEELKAREIFFRAPMQGG